MIVFLIVEVMCCDYGTEESVVGAKSTQELADARVRKLESEVKCGHKPRYKYTVSWYVMSVEVDE